MPQDKNNQVPADSVETTVNPEKAPQTTPAVEPQEQAVEAQQKEPAIA
jgi:hypothetical protein